MRTFLVFAPLRSCTNRPGRMTFSPGFPSAHPGQLDRKTHHSPLHRHPASRPLPREELPRASAPGSHPRSPVPSSWFGTTSTASSASQFAGLLHPAAGPGVRGVSASAPPTEGRGCSGFLSAQDSHPSKEPPDDSRAASPRPLPPCRSSRAPRQLAALHCWGVVCGGGGRGASTSRPCSITGSRRRAAPLLAWPNRSFLGFVPLQGPSRRLEIPLPPSTRARRPPKGSRLGSSVPHPRSPATEVADARRPRRAANRATGAPCPRAGACEPPEPPEGGARA